MIYKFKKWVLLPAYTEVIVSAESDEEALKILNAQYDGDEAPF